MELKRGDLIEVGDTQYLITEMEGKLYAWDFEAWAEGYYDAYLGITDDWGYGLLPLDEAIREGNIYDNPGLLPSVCEGYDGEPSPVKVETIWTNKNFSGCADGSKPCCERPNEYNGFASGPLLFECQEHCSCHD